MPFDDLASVALAATLFAVAGAWGAYLLFEFWTGGPK